WSGPAPTACTRTPATCSATSTRSAFAAPSDGATWSRGPSGPRLDQSDHLGDRVSQHAGAEVIQLAVGRPELHRVHLGVEREGVVVLPRRLVLEAAHLPQG